MFIVKENLIEGDAWRKRPEKRKPPNMQSRPSGALFLATNQNPKNPESDSYAKDRKNLKQTALMTTRLMR
jgi:hypothetical protein